MGVVETAGPRGQAPDAHHICHYQRGSGAGGTLAFGDLRPQQQGGHETLSLLLEKAAEAPPKTTAWCSQQHT